jgi:1-acyl-sn-glycerol-3-phosphate acyltransferase
MIIWCAYISGMIYETFVAFLVIYLLLGLISVRALRRGLKEVAACDALRENRSIAPRHSPFMRPPGILLPPRIQLYLKSFFLAPIGSLYIPFIFSILLIVGFVTRRNPSFVLPYLLPGLVKLLGFNIIVKGIPENVPLYVMNHSAMFDPAILASVVSNVTALAKSDVRSLPIIGRGMKMMGCIFVDRGNEQNRKAAVEGISSYLREWRAGLPSVIVYPEGTTTANTEVIPFKSGAFQTCTPFQAVRIEYPNPHCSFSCSTNPLVPVVLCFALGGGDLVLTFVPSTSKGEDETPEEVAERARKLVAGDKLVISADDAGYRSHLELTKQVADMASGKMKGL